MNRQTRPRGRSEGRRSDSGRSGATRQVLNTRLIFVIGPLVMIGAAGCKRGAAEAQNEQAPSALSAGAQAAAADVLVTYEALRAQLAADAMARVPALAERLERAAGGLGQSEPGALKAQATALEAGARQIRASKDIEKARLAFGEVSRQVVSILVIEPSLQRGRFVFECSMAPGYKKWVQATSNIENPYMGKAMLSCGSETSWTS
jgi:membrane fusion protein, copper/silver efflux system